MSVVELLEFRLEDTIYRYTSSRRKYINAIGEIYNPIPVSRSVIVKSDADQRQVELEVPMDNEVAQLYLSNIPDSFVTCKISRVYKGEESVYWTGHISSVSYEANKGESAKATIKATSIINSLSRQGLSQTFSFGCNHALYSQACGARFDDFAIKLDVTALEDNGTTLIAPDLIGYPEGHFVNGLIRFQNSYRMIIGYNSEVGSISLMSQVQDLKVGKIIKVAKGCDRSFDACQTFSNTDNYLGFRHIPTENPFDSGIMRPRDV